MDEVVGIELTAKEIEEYLISKIDSDEKFIEEFPKTEFSLLHPTESSQYLKSKSKELQLDLAYEIFKSFISFQSTIFKEYKLPPEFSLKDYLPFTEIIDSVSSLENTCVEDLDDEQKLQVWIHKRLFYGIMYTKSTVIEAYSYKPPTFEEFKDEWQKKVGLKTRTLDYFLEAEDHFKSRINRQPDLQTKKLIQELKDKVQELVKKDLIAVKLDNNNKNILSDKIVAEKREIAYNISFASEWADCEPPPTIHNTEILCKWESKFDYVSFLEKLLYIDLLEKSISELDYSNEELRKDIERKKRIEKWLLIPDKKEFIEKNKYLLKGTIGVATAKVVIAMQERKFFRIIGDNELSDFFIFLKDNFNVDGVERSLREAFKKHASNQNYFSREEIESIKDLIK